MLASVDLAALAKPWADLYDHSKVLSSLVTGVHIAALTVGGGLAIAADRMTFRVFRRAEDDRVRHLQEIQAIHAPVIVALGALFVTGVMMAASDLDTFLPSPVFWTKLGLVTLLLVNGAFLKGTEERLLRMATGEGAATNDRRAALWRRLRVTSGASIALWMTTLAVGVALSNVS